MGIKEREHEVHLLTIIKDEKWLPHFEPIFSWSIRARQNDVDLDLKYPVTRSDPYRNNDPAARASKVADDDAGTAG